MLKAISLYTGIGGLDFGFEAAGFETAVAVELDRYACSTLRTNRNWPIIEADINQVTSGEILDAAGLRVGEADVLIGGPPCQPFSKASYWVRGDTLRLDDPRANTLEAYLRVLRDTRPKSFLLENVKGLTFKNKDEGLQLILNTIEKINSDTGTNYSVEWKSLNCANYGVPQLRERVFLVGSRDGKPFQFPQETHGSEEEARSNLFLEPHTTCWDAFLGLEPPESLKGLEIGGKWGDLLPSIPEGENYLWHTNRKGGLQLFGWRTRYWSFLLKLAKNSPSWTIQAQPGSSIGPFHWTNRKLTFEELCRLQTFPDGLRMEFGRTEMQRMLGNAVPSLIAEVLANGIKEQFLGCAGNKELKLIPRKNPAPVIVEKVKAVPKKYLGMINNHADHPGTGKGRRAAKLLEAAS